MQHLPGLHPVALSLLLSLPAVAQCPLPQSTQLDTLFQGTTALAGIDPVFGSNLLLDVSTDQAGITISEIGVNLRDDGSGGLPNLVGQTAELEVWAMLPPPTTHVGSAAPGTGGATGYPPAPPGWTSLGKGQLVVGPPNSPSMATFTSPLVLPQGTFAVALNHLPVIAGEPNAGAPLHPFVTDPAVRPTPLQTGDQFLTVTAGQAQSLAWTGPVATPRVPNVRIVYSAQPGSAHSTQLGRGCLLPQSTIYESFAASHVPGGVNVDLANSSVRFVPAGSVYRVTNGTSTFPRAAIVPGSTFYYGGSSFVNLGAPAQTTFGGWDEATSVPYALPFPITPPGSAAGPVNDIVIGSNGAVWLGARQPRVYRLWPLDSYRGWLNGPPSFAVGYMDLWPWDGNGQQGGVGDIWIDSDGVTYVTVSWVNCQEYMEHPVNFATGLNFQITLFATGDVELTFGHLANGSSTLLVGYTSGDGARDPGDEPTPRQRPDLSAARTVPGGFLPSAGSLVAGLSLDTRPAVGRPLTLRVTNVDPSAAADVLMLSFAPTTPVTRLEFLGLPGCDLYLGVPIVASDLQLAPGSHTWAAVPAIPPAFVGVALFAQAAQLTTAVPAWNAPNFLFSDAVCFRFGAQ